MIGSLCTCASLHVWECVVAFFVIVVDFATLLVRKPFGFCVGQTDSKYPQNNDSDFSTRRLQGIAECPGTITDIVLKSNFGMPTFAL